MLNRRRFFSLTFFGQGLNVFYIFIDHLEVYEIIRTTFPKENFQRSKKST